MGKKSSSRNLAIGGTVVIGLPLVGCITLPVLVVVIVLAAVGNFLGWLFGGGASSYSANSVEQNALHSPASTIHLWTPTPIPGDCFITPTPRSITVFPTVDPGSGNGNGDTSAPITVWLPTRTPCPTPINNWATPDPRWTPVPEGYGPHGSPFRSSYVVTQPYGCTDFPEFKDQVCAASSGGQLPWFHRGIDLASMGDKTVYATISGQAIYAGWGNDGFGNRVYLSAPPFLVIYPHLSQVLVAPGQNVAWGQPLGVEGSTGYSTGDHLHYEIHLNGAWVDSTYYLLRV